MYFLKFKISREIIDSFVKVKEAFILKRNVSLLFIFKINKRRHFRNNEKRLFCTILAVIGIENPQILRRMLGWLFTIGLIEIKNLFLRL